uniref:DUF5741 domain-containing protein n=1 Tax=Panagrellus redivivus TaxID=6233 RepID=A0A7E4UVA1_PANRE
MFNTFNNLMNQAAAAATKALTELDDGASQSDEGEDSPRLVQKLKDQANTATKLITDAAAMLGDSEPFLSLIGKFVHQNLPALEGPQADLFYDWVVAYEEFKEHFSVDSVNKLQHLAKEIGETLEASPELNNWFAELRELRDRNAKLSEEIATLNNQQWDSFDAPTHKSTESLHAPSTHSSVSMPLTSEGQPMLSSGSDQFEEVDIKEADPSRQNIELAAVMAQLQSALDENSELRATMQSEIRNKDDALNNAMYAEASSIKAVHELNKQLAQLDSDHKELQTKYDKLTVLYERNLRNPSPNSEAQQEIRRLQQIVESQKESLNEVRTLVTKLKFSENANQTLTAQIAEMNAQQQCCMNTNEELKQHIFIASRQEAIHQMFDLECYANAIDSYLTIHKIHKTVDGMLRKPAIVQNDLVQVKNITYANHTSKIEQLLGEMEYLKAAMSDKALVLFDTTEAAQLLCTVDKLVAETVAKVDSSSAAIKQNEETEIPFEIVQNVGLLQAELKETAEKYNNLLQQNQGDQSNAEVLAAKQQLTQLASGQIQTLDSAITLVSNFLTECKVSMDEQPDNRSLYEERRSRCQQFMDEADGFMSSPSSIVENFEMFAQQMGAFVQDLIHMKAFERQSSFFKSNILPMLESLRNESSTIKRHIDGAIQMFETMGISDDVGQQSVQSKAEILMRRAGDLYRKGADSANKGSSTDVDETLSTFLKFLENYYHDVLVKERQIKVNEIGQLKTVAEEKDVKLAELQALSDHKDSDIANLKAVANARDAEIAQLKTAVNEEDSEVAQLKAITDEKNAEIASLKVATDEKDAKIAQLQALSEHKDSDLSHLRTVTAQKDAEIAQLKAVADEESPEFEQLKAIANNKDAEIAQLRAIANERDAEIAKLKAFTDEKNAELASWKTATDEKDAKIANLQALSDHKDSDISHLRAVTAHKDAEIERLKSVAHDGPEVELKAITEEKNAEIAHLKTATNEKNGEIAQLRAAIEENEAKINSLVAEKNAEIEELKDLFKTRLTNEENAKFEAERVLKDSDQYYRNILAEANERIRTLEELLHNKNNELAMLQSQNQQQPPADALAHLSHFEAECGRLNNALLNKEEVENNLRQEIKNIADTLDRQNAEIERNRKTIQYLKEELASKDNDIDEACTARDKALQQLKNDSTTNGLTQIVKSQGHEIVQHKQKFNELMVKVNNLKEQERILTSESANKDGIIKGLEQRLAEADQEIQRLTTELSNIPEEATGSDNSSSQTANAELQDLRQKLVILRESLFKLILDDKHTSDHHLLMISLLDYDRTVHDVLVNYVVGKRGQNFDWFNSRYTFGNVGQLADNLIKFVEREIAKNNVNLAPPAQAEPAVHLSLEPDNVESSSELDGLRDIL